MSFKTTILYGLPSPYAMRTTRRNFKMMNVQQKCAKFIINQQVNTDKSLYS